MVARGDLGAELPIEEVPILQVSTCLSFKINQRMSFAISTDLELLVVKTLDFNLLYRRRSLTYAGAWEKL